MPDVAFEYKKLFKGAKVDEVFDAILAWLATKGAKVKKTEKPTLISALVGREDVPWNWDKEMKRMVDFELVTSPDYVGIGVWQAPVRSTVKRVLESPLQANITWRDWLNECWEFVQGKVGPAPMPAGAPMRIPSAKTVTEPGKAPPPAPPLKAAALPPPPPKAPPPKPAPEPSADPEKPTDETA